MNGNIHVQYEISKATSLALNRHCDKAQAALDQAQAQYQQNVDDRQAFEQKWPSTIAELEKEKELIEQAPILKKRVDKAANQFEQAHQRRQLARDARCGISLDYHPFDLHNGQALAANQVKETLENHFKTLHAVADQAKLSQGAVDRINKSERVLQSMVGTIAFFWSMVELMAKHSACSDAVISIWKNELVETDIRPPRTQKRDGYPGWLPVRAYIHTPQNVIIKSAKNSQQCPLAQVMIDAHRMPDGLSSATCSSH